MPSSAADCNSCRIIAAVDGDTKIITVTLGLSVVLYCLMLLANLHKRKITLTVILYCINVFILMKIYPVMNVRSLLEMICTLV